MSDRYEDHRGIPAISLDDAIGDAIGEAMPWLRLRVQAEQALSEDAYEQFLDILQEELWGIAREFGSQTDETDAAEDIFDELDKYQVKL